MREFRRDYGQGAGGLVQTRGTNSTSFWTPTKPRRGSRRSRTPMRLRALAHDHYRRCEDRRYIVIGKDMGRGSAGSTPRAAFPKADRLHALLQFAGPGRLRRRRDAGARLCRRPAV